MGIFNRFLGRKEPEDNSPSPLVANPNVESPLSLQVVFPRPVTLDAAGIAAALRGYHRETSRAACELDPATAAQGTPLGLAGWGKHVIRIVGFNAPLPPQTVEACVAPAHYPEDIKRQVRATQAHVILYYAGYESDPVEQSVALAAVAGCLQPQGALAVLNESARTSLPLAVVAPGVHSDMLFHLRNLPLLLLYAGFVKGEVPGVAGVWMRTFGCPLLGLPDFAMHTPSHDWGQTTFDMFGSLLDYMRSSGACIVAGNTSQVGEDEFLRFRDPLPQESFLYPEGPLLVVERITAAEING
ncbi:MAG: hypothetical protein ACO1SX_03140 [Actinomycetota bacterium]